MKSELHTFLLDPALPRLVIAAVFVFILLFATLRLVLFGDDAKESLKKLVGGISVFSVALVINNPYLYFVSFFIGGLLIATENFLIRLASVLRAERKDIPSIITPLRPEEIAAKTIREPLEPSLSPATPTKKNAKSLEKSKLNAVEIERLVLERLDNRVRSMPGRQFLQQYVRLQKDGQSQVFDAVLLNEAGNAVLGIEVKVFGQVYENLIAQYLINYRAEAEATGLSLLLTIVLVSPTPTAIKLLKDLRKNFVSEKFGISIYEHDNAGRKSSGEMLDPFAAIETSDEDRFLPQATLKDALLSQL